ncbi:hypothetical protein [Nocardioides sp. cx-173]|uniref:hypothetical protein n=1 Tax=Nocardioides sp. cx-173 TaxID=2898796 RepID=UPI001E3F26E2|nr:hypothetical protein [Nocardioides sp. cx-173]MCD4524851.1 hypothetical protein [Nocardioides sp. cx-173]UGB43355.1 hypothetical protein LQ940_07455 [Nocardioides sp. cx-173]
MSFYLPRDADYQWVKRLRRGDERLDPVFDTFVARFRDRFGVTPLAVKVDALAIPRSTGHRPRLLVVLERKEQHDAFHTGEFDTPDRDKHDAVKRIFVESMADVDLHARFALPGGAAGPIGPDGIFGYFRDFETVAKLDAHAQVQGAELDDFVAALDLGDRFWCTNRFAGPPIVFVHTRAQAEALATPAVARRWADLYWPYVKAHDEFDYLRRDEITVPVDSRQSFEEGYEANWYYYFK